LGRKWGLGLRRQRIKKPRIRWQTNEYAVEFKVRAQGLEPWTYGLKVVHESASVIAYAVETDKS